MQNQQEENGNGVFRSTTLGVVSLEQVIHHIKSFLKEDPNAFYSLIIGSDSHQKNIHSLREKIYSETLESLNFALVFVPLFKKSLNGSAPVYNLEIHVDVGEHGETRDMIKEVVGMVVGNGFVAKTKPEAYGASYVADKHT